MTDTREPRPGGEVVVYEALNGEVALDVRLEQDTVWLTMRQMAELFERDRSVVNRHVLNVFQEGELERGATCADFAQVRPEGGRRVTLQESPRRGARRDSRQRRSFPCSDIASTEPCEEQAANLLYFQVKDHPFRLDANKLVSGYTSQPALRLRQEELHHDGRPAIRSTALALEHCGISAPGGRHGPVGASWNSSTRWRGRYMAAAARILTSDRLEAAAQARVGALGWNVAVGRD